MRILGFILAALFGLFLTFVGEHLLLGQPSGHRGIANLSVAMAFAITTAGIAGAVALMKTSYKLTLEPDVVIIDRRASLILVFTISAITSALIVFQLTN